MGINAGTEDHHGDDGKVGRNGISGKNSSAPFPSRGFSQVLVCLHSLATMASLSEQALAALLESEKPDEEGSVFPLRPFWTSLYLAAS